MDQNDPYTTPARDTTLCISPSRAFGAKLDTKQVKQLSMYSFIFALIEGNQ